MVQILPARRTFGAEFGRALGGGLSQGISKGLESRGEKRKLSQQDQAASNYYEQITGEKLPENLSPEIKKSIFTEMLKSQGKQQLQDRELAAIEELFGGGQQRSRGAQLAGMGQETQEEAQGQNVPVEGHDGINPLEITPEQILKATAVKPNLGKAVQGLRDTALRQEEAKTKEERRQFEGERKFHTDAIKDTEKFVGQLRDTLPKKEMALDFARNAVESGDLGYFSLDRLADATGQDIFRTAKGAQLLTAGKENLLTNMARVGAKAQNQWFEQRLNSMFPKIGQSKEANLTVQEMIEGELAMDQAYISEYDRISSDDEGKYGFVKKDIGKRVQSALQPVQKEIFNRTSYKMKEIEEQEKGLQGVKKEVGKNVSKGTPLTLAMAKLYVDKFGDKALDIAKKNGYYVPTLEEFKTFQTIGREFRESLRND